MSATILSCCDSYTFSFSCKSNKSAFNSSTVMAKSYGEHRPKSEHRRTSLSRARSSYHPEYVRVSSWELLFSWTTNEGCTRCSLTKSPESNTKYPHCVNDLNSSDASLERIPNPESWPESRIPGLARPWRLAGSRIPNPGQRAKSQPSQALETADIWHQTFCRRVFLKICTASLRPLLGYSVFH